MVKYTKYYKAECSRCGAEYQKQSHTGTKWCEPCAPAGRRETRERQALERKLKRATNASTKTAEQTRDQLSAKLKQENTDCQNCYGQGNGCGDDYSCPCMEGE